jgi:hypothetical protein
MSKRRDTKFALGTLETREVAAERGFRLGARKKRVWR